VMSPMPGSCTSSTARSSWGCQGRQGFFQEVDLYPKS
jgi:hypothetical protein